MLVMMARTGEASSRLLLLGCLYDHQVYAWRLPDQWFTQQHLQQVRQQRQQRQEQEQQQQEQEQQEPQQPSQPRQQQAGQQAAAQQAPGPQGESCLQLFLATPSAEPICDLSLSFPQARVYVVAMHNLYIADLAGALLATIAMAGWVSGAAVHDLGAFSWPLPHSQRVALHLDATGGVYVMDTGGPQLDYAQLAALPGGDNLVSTHVAVVPGEPPGYYLYKLQSHR